MKRTRLTITSLALIALTLTLSAQAKNVDLSTVPRRDTVQLTIYNSEDLTLVRETRKVTFKQGVNPLQFSWANTLIDPTSVELRFLTQPDKLDVLDTTYPHDKPQMLYWNVDSGFDGEATIEITYFTSGITWQADYVCITDADEKMMGFEGFVRVSNRSGEAYDDAQVRLVVGKINLVEKIAQLARVTMSEVGRMKGVRKKEFRKQALRQAVAEGMMFSAADAAEPMAAPKQIVKEGLSEYFIYTIEGTETIPDGWSKRMRSFEGQTVPLKIQYRYRPQEYGDQLVRLYLLTNDKDSNLGTTPLPDGTVRVFRSNGRDGLSFLASQQIKYVPIGDKIELNLGADPEVIFELVKLRTTRDNIWMKLHGADVVRRVDDGNVKVNARSQVVGWDQRAVYAQRVRNYTRKPIEVEVRRRFDGHTVFRSQLSPTLHDYRTVQLHTKVGGGQSKDLLYEVLTHQGRNAKQSNVTLEDAKVQIPS